MNKRIALLIVLIALFAFSGCASLYAEDVEFSVREEFYLINEAVNVFRGDASSPSFEPVVVRKSYSDTETGSDDGGSEGSGEQDPLVDPVEPEEPEEPEEPVENELEDFEIIFTDTNALGDENFDVSVYNTTFFDAGVYDGVFSGYYKGFVPYLYRYNNYNDRISFNLEAPGTVYVLAYSSVYNYVVLSNEYGGENYYYCGDSLVTAEFYCDEAGYREIRAYNDGVYIVAVRVVYDKPEPEEPVEPEEPEEPEYEDFEILFTETNGAGDDNFGVNVKHTQYFGSDVSDGVFAGNYFEGSVPYLFPYGYYYDKISFNVEAPCTIYVLAYSDSYDYIELYNENVFENEYYVYGLKTAEFRCVEAGNREIRVYNNRVCIVAIRVEYDEPEPALNGFEINFADYNGSGDEDFEVYVNNLDYVTKTPSSGVFEGHTIDGYVPMLCNYNDSYEYIGFYVEKPCVVYVLTNNYYSNGYLYLCDEYSNLKDRYVAGGLQTVSFSCNTDGYYKILAGSAYYIDVLAVRVEYLDSGDIWGEYIY